jgi:hypothetical protein
MTTCVYRRGQGARPDLRTSNHNDEDIFVESLSLVDWIGLVSTIHRAPSADNMQGED